LKQESTSSLEKAPYLRRNFWNRTIVYR